jgi:hypothetical protein
MLRFILFTLFFMGLFKLVRFFANLLVTVILGILALGTATVVSARKAH